MEKETRKALNFDLDTKALKTYYCKTNNPFEVLGAYREIKKFLEQYGFSHRQWSGYTSDEPMTSGEVSFLITELSKQKPWFSKCVRKCDETEIGEQYDLMTVIQDAAKNNTIEAKKPKVKEEAHSEQRCQTDTQPEKTKPVSQKKPKINPQKRIKDMNTATEHLFYIILLYCKGFVLFVKCLQMRDAGFFMRSEKQ